jgi:predicted enzyme related to lactoylglutathione lyase
MKNRKMAWHRGWRLFFQYGILDGVTTDEKGNKASVGGGMMKRQDPLQQITNFIDVKSVDEYSSKIEKLGGKVVVSKMAVPGMGYFAVCHDTENNSFGIWESDESAK